MKCEKCSVCKCWKLACLCLDKKEYQCRFVGCSLISTDSGYDLGCDLCVFHRKFLTCIENEYFNEVTCSVFNDYENLPRYSSYEMLLNNYKDETPKPKNHVLRLVTGFFLTIGLYGTWVYLTLGKINPWLNLPVSCLLGYVIGDVISKY